MSSIEMVKNSQVVQKCEGDEELVTQDTINAQEKVFVNDLPYSGDGQTRL